MKTVGIICEYNPFHNGHMHQICEVRKKLGPDTALVAIMSGNFTQRGEVAVADKSVRAKAALCCGIDLVLELPFPYSMSSAEFYARAGVHIVNSLGVCDYLAFGSESGEFDSLGGVARATLTDEFKERVLAMQSLEQYREMGYPRLMELAASELVPGIPEGLFSPNNILAIEYLRAIYSTESNILPLTVKREGAGYNESSEVLGNLQSASAIRSMLTQDVNKALSYIPDEARSVFSSAYAQELFPTVPERLDTALISFLRLNSPEGACDIHDAAGGLYNRLHDLSFEAHSISSLVSSAQTKKFTKARIRRAVWNSFFGVTSSEVRRLPSYTQLLACNSVGRGLLRKIKKCGRIPVITKPSDFLNLGQAVIGQKERSDRADSIFALAHKRAVSGRFSLKLTPYVTKD